MNQRWLHVALAVWLCCSPSLLAESDAQSPTQPPTQPPAQLPAQRPTTPSTSPPSELLLTGCLRGSAAAMGTSPGQGMIYTLEAPETLPPVPSAAPSTGATARTGAAATTTYTLSAPETVGLAKHVDHEVQITGAMQAPSTPASTPGTAASASPGAATGGKPGGAHRTVQVTAVKMISANCPK